MVQLELRLKFGWRQRRGRAVRNYTLKATGYITHVFMVPCLPFPILRFGGHVSQSVAELRSFKKRVPVGVSNYAERNAYTTKSQTLT